VSAQNKHNLGIAHGIIDQVKHAYGVEGSHLEEEGAFDKLAEWIVKEVTACPSLDTGYFHITSLHRDDIKHEYPKEYHHLIDRLSDKQMREFASKLADAFCSCCYWESLKSITEETLEDDMERFYRVGI